jgi:hypothetical protein
MAESETVRAFLIIACTTTSHDPVTDRYERLFMPCKHKEEIIGRMSTLRSKQGSNLLILNGLYSPGCSLPVNGENWRGPEARQSDEDNHRQDAVL